MSDSSNLSERDLLIELKTDLRAFKEYAKEKFENLERNFLKIDGMESRLDKLEPVVEENTNIRKKINGLGWAMILEAFAIVGMYIKNFVFGG